MNQRNEYVFLSQVTFLLHVFTVNRQLDKKLLKTQLDYVVYCSRRGSENQQYGSASAWRD